MAKPNAPWAVIGIHGTTVGDGVVIPQTHLRVRYFPNPDDENEHVDEDVRLIDMPPEVPKTEAVYIGLMRANLDARHAQLAAESASRHALDQP